MPTNSANEAQGTPFAQRFQESVTLIECNGKPVVVAREFGAFLGYGDEGRLLVTLITGDWSDEFIPDVDSILLKNGRLAEFKKACAALGLTLVDKRAPSLLLLTQSGIQLVLSRSEKPEGKTFRRWLVSEALPGYEAARRGSAIPSSNAPQIDGPAPPVASVRRTPRPRRVTGPAAELADLLDRYQRVGVLDPSAYTALRAQVERLGLILSAQAQRALPAPPARLLLTGPVGSLEAELDQAIGPPPSDTFRRITYDVARQSLKAAAEARAGGGKPNSDNNIRRVNGIVTWMRWIRIPHMSAEDVSQALTRMEELTDSLFGSMPGAKVRATQS